MIKEGRKDAEEGTGKEKKFGRENSVGGNSCGNIVRERWKGVEIEMSDKQLVSGKKEKNFLHSRTGQFAT